MFIFISDHCLILVKINSVADPLPSHWSPRWSSNRADWISFYHLCNAEITMNLFSTDTQLFYYRFTSTIFSIAERTIPTTKPHSKLSVPWWNKACQVAINNKKHALKRMLKTRNPTDILIFKRVRAKAKKILNEEKNIVCKITAPLFLRTLNSARCGRPFEDLTGNKTHRIFHLCNKTVLQVPVTDVKLICWQISFRKSVAMKTFQTVSKETFNQFLISYTNK